MTGSSVQARPPAPEYSIIVLGTHVAYNGDMSPEGFNPGMSAREGRIAERQYQTVELPDLQREYEAVLAREQMLNGRLQKGNEQALQAEHPDLKKVGAELGAEIARELQRVLERKAELEKRITEAGGNPSERTIQ